MCDTYNCDHLKHIVSTSLIFSEIQISLPNFAFFTVKSPSVTQRLVSQENAYNKRAKTCRLFFTKL